jgi:hypothetical protein
MCFTAKFFVLAVLAVERRHFAIKVWIFRDFLIKSLENRNLFSSFFAYGYH